MEKNKFYKAFLIIVFITCVIVFYCICSFGFLWGDDYAMGYGEVFSLQDVFRRSFEYYRIWGGRLFAFTCQFLFCGLLGNSRIWFSIVDTLVFFFFLILCSRMVQKEKEYNVGSVFFVLLFWFLCPIPRETLFWIGGATCYLWSHLLLFLFLFVFECVNNKDFPIVHKILLLLLGVFSSTSEISSISICGAFVVYFLFHLKEFKGNTVPLVIGFVVGTLVLLLAPGNFARMQAGEQDGFFLWSNLKDLALHLPKEIIKYRAFWLLVAALLVGIRKDKIVIWKWMRSNWLLFLSLGWSVIAFSVVFRPYQRALFFTETVSLILLLRFVTDPASAALFDGFMNCIRNRVGERLFASRHVLVLSLLFMAFAVDAGFAINETVKQRNNNERLLGEIVAAGGIAAVDYPLSSHRMAYAPDYPKWSWPGISRQFDLDSVHVYPYYCQEKYYKDSPYGNRVWFDADGLLDVDPNYHLSKNCMIYFRLLVEEMAGDKSVTFRISYSKPHKWWREWIDKRRNYVYEREAIVGKDKPDEVFAGYNYYVVWFLKENAKNLKSIEYEVE